MGNGCGASEGSMTIMAEDYEDLPEFCLGRVCFVPPHSKYVPPPYYPRIPRKEYRWKVGSKFSANAGVLCKISHAVTLPNILGLDPEARWRWQWIPVSIMTSVAFRIWPLRDNAARESLLGESAFSRDYAARLSPRARFKILTPVFGKLALRPVVELLPTPSLTIRRQFRFGTTKLNLQADVEICTMDGRLKWPKCFLQVNWHPADMLKVTSRSGKDIAMKYSRSFDLFSDCKAVATGHAAIPGKSVLGASGVLAALPLRARFDSLKVSYIITDKAAKTTPLSAWTYLRASRSIGMQDLISVVPGHWVDPGWEIGAPGERLFNMEVANVIEKQLMGNGWKVLRPDRDSPSLTWEEYLNWVAKQTIQGIPVLEIHGQGSKADYRGFVLGVIGNVNAPLNKELGKDFGHFQMDWTDLGLPKRGGALLEAFNSDEVLQMAPWHRKWSVRRLANRIVTCIERASRHHRTSRGVIVENDSDDEQFALDSSYERRQ